jgi:predicted porin
VRHSRAEFRMLWKIIALAIAGLVSGAAFAQSNVTISGYFDAALVNSTADGKNSSWNAAYGVAGTNQITVKATEDLGGGMKAGVLLETDIRGSGTTYAGGAAHGTNGAAFGGFQHYIFITKDGIGDLSFGQRTNMISTSLVTVQPYGTALGGGDSSGFTRTRGGGFEAYGVWTATGRDVRPDAAVHFRSASWSGVSFGIDFKPLNNSGPTSTGEDEATSSSGYTGLGINYNNGPLNLTFAQSKASTAFAGGTFSATTGVFTAAAAYNSSIKNTALGGNYTFGPATVYAGWTRSVADTAVAAGNEADSRSWNIALKYAVTPTLAITGNYLRDDDKTALDVDRKLFALGLDYSLSKRTTAFARYNTQDTNLNGTTGANVGKTTNTAFGLKHSF